MHVLRAPQSDADLDVGSLRIWEAVDDDGRPVLVLRDVDTTVVIDCADGGASDAAMRAAERLSDAALMFASTLRAAMVKAKQDQNVRRRGPLMSIPPRDRDLSSHPAPIGGGVNA